MQSNKSRSRLITFSENTNKALLVSICLNFVLAISFICSIYFEKDPRIVGITNDLRIMELPDLRKPYITDARLAQFVTSTVPEVLSLDFDKYLRTIQDAQINFSPTANSQYIRLLEARGWLDIVRQKRLLVHCVISSPPMITKRWLQDGRMNWEIQAPLLISVESSQGTLSTKNYKLVTKLQRCALQENPRGVWISTIQIL